MTRIDHVELAFMFMPDIIEVRVNHQCIYRAKADNDTVKTAVRLRAYYERKAHE